MDQTLVMDLVALVRRQADRALPDVHPVASPSVMRELGELARRARVIGATDEELALSIGVVLALSQASAGMP